MIRLPFWCSHWNYNIALKFDSNPSGGIPPPPPPPLTAPPAGMTFPRLPMPFGQTIPPPPQPPAFVPSMMMRSEPVVPAAPPVSSASTVTFPRRTTPATWPVKAPPFRPPSPSKTEPEPKHATDSPPKVVLRYVLVYPFRSPEAIFVFVSRLLIFTVQLQNFTLLQLT